LAAVHNRECRCTALPAAHIERLENNVLQTASAQPFDKEGCRPPLVVRSSESATAFVTQVGQGLS
jgi:hypothetical protein